MMLGEAVLSEPMLRSANSRAVAGREWARPSVVALSFDNTLSGGIVNPDGPGDTDNGGS